MDLRDLDQQIDGLMERLAGAAGPQSNPYRTDPLASDHLLLKQSWDFFKRRVAAIEKQWQDIVSSKSDEIRLLKKQLGEQQERLEKLESERLASEDFLRSMELARLEDHGRFKRDKEILVQRWEEERMALETDRRRLEHDLSVEREKIADYQKSIRDLQALLNTAKRERAGAEVEWKEKNASLAQSLHEQLVEKDELFRAEQHRTELLQAELDRRDQFLSEAANKQIELERQCEVLKQAVISKDESLRILETDLRREQEDLKRLQAERSRLLDDWQREKAEWRELWDRKRG